MNETTPPASPADTKARLPGESASSHRKRVAAAKKTRTPRVVSPEVEAIRKECRDKIKALRGSKVGERILGVIINKQLPKLTTAHREFLFNHLAGEFTPGLAMLAKTAAN